MHRNSTQQKDGKSSALAVHPESINTHEFPVPFFWAGVLSGEFFSFKIGPLCGFSANSACILEAGVRCSLMRKFRPILSNVPLNVLLLMPEVHRCLVVHKQLWKANLWQLFCLSVHVSTANAWIYFSFLFFFFLICSLLQSLRPQSHSLLLLWTSPQLQHFWVQIFSVGSWLVQHLPWWRLQFFSQWVNESHQSWEL